MQINIAASSHWKCCLYANIYYNKKSLKFIKEDWNRNYFAQVQRYWSKFTTNIKKRANICWQRWLEAMQKRNKEKGHHLDVTTTSKKNVKFKVVSSFDIRMYDCKYYSM